MNPVDHQDPSRGASRHETTPLPTADAVGACHHRTCTKHRVPRRGIGRSCAHETALEPSSPRRSTDARTSSLSSCRRRTPGSRRPHARAPAPAARHRHQISIEPPPRPEPAGSSDGGFRTPAIRTRANTTARRHPKPFTGRQHHGTPASETLHRKKRQKAGSSGLAKPAFYGRSAPARLRLKLTHYGDARRPSNMVRSTSETGHGHAVAILETRAGDHVSGCGGRRRAWSRR